MRTNSLCSTCALKRGSTVVVICIHFYFWKVVKPRVPSLLVTNITHQRNNHFPKKFNQPREQRKKIENLITYVRHNLFGILISKRTVHTTVGQKKFGTTYTQNRSCYVIVVYQTNVNLWWLQVDGHKFSFHTILYVIIEKKQCFNTHNLCTSLSVYNKRISQNFHYRANL